MGDEPTRGLPKPTLKSHHTEGGVLLPNRTALLRRLPKEAIVAEIGVASGDFTAEILEHTKPRKLHLVDSWGSERYSSGECRVRERFATEIATGRVVIHKGRSTEMLAFFPPGYFEWVYIDTDHTYPTTAKELALCSDVVVPTGFITGHDFCAGNVARPVVYGVIPAVNEFCVTKGWRYDAVTLENHGHFSFSICRQTT